MKNPSSALISLSEAVAWRQELKNSGRRLRDLASEDPGFLRWMLRSDFSDEVKTVIKNALAGEFPTRKA